MTLRQSQGEPFDKLEVRQTNLMLSPSKHEPVEA
jgi:hypothetical protein